MVHAQTLNVFYTYMLYFKTKCFITSVKLYTTTVHKSTSEISVHE